MHELSIKTPLNNSIRVVYENIDYTVLNVFVREAASSNLVTLSADTVDALYSVLQSLRDKQMTCRLQSDKPTLDDLMNGTNRVLQPNSAQTL